MATLLIVDDDPTILSLCRQILRLGGHTVVEASGGDAALRLPQLAANSIDLALLDVVMPGMNGIELAGRLRAAYPNVPIVLMSGYGPKDIAGILGPQNYPVIWKPFKTDSFLRMIENALSAPRNIPPE